MSAFSSCSSTRAVVHPRPDQRKQQSAWNEPVDALCHRLRSHLAQQRSCTTTRNSPWRAATRTWLTLKRLYIFVVFGAMLCQRAAANHIHVARNIDLVEGAALVYDRSPPPPIPMWLHRRQETSSSTPSSAELSSHSGRSHSSSSSAEASLSTATPTDQTSLPRPFDSSLGNNFTSPSCPEFFHSFLTNSSFKDCLPLSMLLQTSNSFFSAEKSPVRLSQTLAATCNVNFTICSNVMASLAEQIQWQSNCGQDFQYQNPVVLQAYNALIAYPPLYHAGCLTDSDGNYCFANAVTNKSAPTGAYIYYLPLGVELPAGTQPTCDKCLQNTMTIFATAAGNSSLPLSKDYTSAAQTVDSECGPAFVESSIAHTSPAATLACPSALIAFIPLIIGIVNFLI